MYATVSSKPAVSSCQLRWAAIELDAAVSSLIGINARLEQIHQRPQLTPVHRLVAASQPPRARRRLGRLLLRLGRSVGRKLVKRRRGPGHIRLLHDDRRLEEDELGVLACLADRAELGVVSNQARWSWVLGSGKERSKAETGGRRRTCFE